MLNPISICHSQNTSYTIEVITTPDEIQLLAKNGYYIQILEEVETGDHHKQEQQHRPSPPTHYY